jgi:polyphosphate kinase 2 (PPK2 family)
MLAESGINIIKYYLDIDQQEQKLRLDARRKDKLKQWKISPIDEKALNHFDDYTAARNTMLMASDSAAAPWIVVRADNKKTARLAIIADILTRVTYHDATMHETDRTIVCRFDETCLTNGMLAA